MNIIINGRARLISDVNELTDLSAYGTNATLPTVVNWFGYDVKRCQLQSSLVTSIAMSATKIPFCLLYLNNVLNEVAATVHYIHVVVIMRFIAECVLNRILRAWTPTEANLRRQQQKMSKKQTLCVSQA